MNTQYIWFATITDARAKKWNIMRVIAMLIVILSVFELSAQELQPLEFSEVTNMVKTPLAMKGLYQNKGKNSQRARTADDAVLRSLRFFKESQNSDGSWGQVKEQNLATPLVLLSFLSRGESASSPEFGGTVIRAREWLLGASPTETAPQLATVVSLSTYCDLSYASIHPEQKTNELAKIQSLMNLISLTNNDIWFDFAAVQTMPGDLSKPLWMRREKEVHEKYRDLSDNKSPLTIDEYLKMYLASRAGFQQGGKSWQEFNRTVVSELMNRQQSDGAFPVSSAHSRFVATALATLRLEIYYQHEPGLRGIGNQ